MTPRIPRVTEKAFMGQVVQLAKLRGWTAYHHLHSRGTQAGWPDLVFVRGPKYATRVLIAELKREGKAPTPDQAATLDALAHHLPGLVHLWTPADWPEIERLLGAE